MTKWFAYILLASVCLLLSCGGKSVREKFAEADRLVNENNLDSAAWLLEEQITLSALSDSDKAEYGRRLRLASSLAGAQLSERLAHRLLSGLL